MDPSAETYQIDVRRTSTDQPWGFRLQGGVDFTTPLSVQSVAPGSPAEQCGLRPQDALLQINGKSTEGWEHDQAKREIIMCTDCVTMIVQRGAVQIWRPQVTKVDQMKPDELRHIQTDPEGEQFVQRTSLAANKQTDYSNIGSSHNRAPKPFAGFGGATSVQAQPAAAPGPQPGYGGQGGGYGAQAGGNRGQGQGAAPGGGGYGQPQYSQPQGPPAGGYNAGMQGQQQQQQQYGQPQGAPQPGGGAPSGMRSVRAPVFDAEHHDKMQKEHMQHHPTCKICGQVILGVFVRIKGHPMHSECYKCVKCGLHLKQQGYFEVDGQFVCENCHS